MTDLECLQIQWMAIAHLMKCGFDDFSLTAIECGNAITERLQKELKE